MVDNEWRMSSFPLVPGHEVVGAVHALGDRVQHLKLGQTVGLGWYSRSCMQCAQCLSGDHNLCLKAQGTMLGRFGGFGDFVRCHGAWAVPVPAGVDTAKAGPLFCGGITVFNPIVQFDVRPAHRVGVIGIGGLGHMAIRFLKAWGLLEFCARHQIAPVTETFPFAQVNDALERLRSGKARYRVVLDMTA